MAVLIQFDGNVLTGDYRRDQVLNRYRRRTGSGLAVQVYYRQGDYIISDVLTIKDSLVKKSVGDIGRVANVNIGHGNSGGIVSIKCDGRVLALCGCNQI